MAADSSSNKMTMRVFMSAVVTILTLPFRVLMGLTKTTLAVLCMLFFVSSLVLPIATTVSQGLFALASTVATIVSDAPSLLKREITQAEKKIASKEVLIAEQRLAKLAADKETKVALVRLETATARAAKADAIIASTEAKLTKQVMKNELSEMQIGALYRDKDGLNTAISKLEVKLAVKADAQVVYRNEKKLMSDAVADAATRVAGRVKKTLAADIGSMPAQAIPYIGATAIVGSISFDAYQSREMIKELHELDVAFNPDHAISTAEVCGMRVPTVAEIWEKAKNAPRDAFEAGVAAIPDFQWQAGWQDLVSQLPSSEELTTAANDAAAGVTSSLPKMYWQEGWADLKGQVSGALSSETTP